MQVGKYTREEIGKIFEFYSNNKNFKIEDKEVWDDNK